MDVDKHPDKLPLCVDLDGTLIRTDLFLESLMSALRIAPWYAFILPFWLFRGKHYCKARIAQIAQPDIGLLPYNDLLLDFIREARVAGRQTLLVTGTTTVLAEQVSKHLGLFDGVIASSIDKNLTGSRKAETLVDSFGEGGFEYAGNSRVDAPIWQSAGAIITVDAPRTYVNRARESGKPHVNIENNSATLKHWLKELRLHQWAKKSTDFRAHARRSHCHRHRGDPISIARFFVFGLVASATYVINDLLDLDSDRFHKSKRFRPIAAGVIPIQQAVLVAGAMLALGIGLSFLLPGAFVFTLFLYLFTTFAYSFGLKRVASLDIVILAGLYTVRVIAGAFAVEVPLSFWLLALSMFTFLCLALVKRVAELLDIAAAQRENPDLGDNVVGREYGLQDITVLQILGATSGYLAVLVMALYINSSSVQNLYRSPELIWLVIPLALLWVTRLWIVTTRGYMHEDPIVFAIKDPETWLTGFVAGVIIVLAAVFDLNLY